MVLNVFLVAKHARALDFAITRLLVKLFRSTNINVVDECRSFFSFMLPSEKTEKEEPILKVKI